MWNKYKLLYIGLALQALFLLACFSVISSYFIPCFIVGNVFLNLHCLRMSGKSVSGFMRDTFSDG